MSGIAWLASYPKSGNTWVRALLDALSRGGPPRLNALVGGARVSWSSAALMTQASRVGDSEFGLLERCLFEQCVDNTVQWQPVKTHNAYITSADGLAVCKLSIPCRAVVVVRDPRDVCPSLAHHAGIGLWEAAGVLATESAVAVEPYLPRAAFNSGSWSTHAASWLEQKDMPVLVVRYEDLSLAPVAELRRIAVFLELECSEPALDDAVRHCDFSNLVVHETLEGFTEAARPEAPFFRRGVVGAWREDLPPDLVRAIEERHGAVMERLGYL